MTGGHPLHGSVLAAVAAGGALGAASRATVDVLAGDQAGFPWPTFAVNAVGSFLLALLPASGFVRHHPLLPPLLGTGVLGGFTTLSAYSEQTRALIAAGDPVTAAGYAVGSVACCLAAVVLADRFSSSADRAEFEDEEGDL